VSLSAQQSKLQCIEETVQRTVFSNKQFAAATMKLANAILAGGCVIHENGQRFQQLQ
jgi:hypothetical protein